MLQLSCQLSDRRRLTYAVDSDHQHYRLLLFKIIGGITHLHLFLNILYQKLLAVHRILDVVFLYLHPQSLKDCLGSLHTEISHDQDLFQFFIEILVDFGKPSKHGIDPVYNVISGLRQTFF